MNLKVNSIEELISNASNPILIKELYEFVLKETKELECYFYQSETITLIGFGKMSYYKPDIYNISWPLIALAPQKNNISLYINGIKDNDYLLMAYKDNFVKSRLGKSCIRYTNAKQVDYELLKEIIKESISWHQQMLIDNK